MKARLLCIIGACIWSSLSYGQLRTLIADGNWGNAASWQSGNIATTLSEDVTMNNNVSVTINNPQTFTVGNVTANNQNILTINAGGTLQLGSPGNPRSLTGGNNTTITVAGTLIIYGELVVNNNLTLSIPAGGVVTIIGNVTMNNNAGLVVNGAVTVGGNFVAGNNANLTVNGTVDVGGSTTVGPGSTLTGTGTFSTGPPCTGPAAFCSGTLPVELLFMQARSTGTSIEVAWATATEVNFSHFEVQRSYDGFHFRTIAEVAGSGMTTTERRDYAITDEKPNNGKNYYRLRSIDLDGTYVFSRVAVATLEVQRDFQLSPNPLAASPLRVDFNFANEPGVLTIYDLSGRVVSRTPVTSRENQIQFDQPLASGLYLVQFTSLSFQRTHRLIVP